MIKINGNENVLVCPLGWGLGHAARLIPIINYLLEEGCKVVIAADQTSIDLLQPRFANCECILFPSINVKFSKGKSQLFSHLAIAIKLIWRTWCERKPLKKLIKQYGIDIVISDNRYGLFSKNVKSVLITHQLSIIFPQPFKWAKPIGEMFVRLYAEKFTECWIPDSDAKISVSGKLSHPKIMINNAKFIGLLSRFNNQKIKGIKNNWDLVGIVSGPEPQREIFEKEIANLANRLNLKAIIIQGLPKGKNHGKIVGKVTLVPHLPDEEMARTILSAKHIICRSGYSTIMDLLALNCSAILVPTPGQTEQEYLAKHLFKKGLFKTQLQSSLKYLTNNNFYSSCEGALNPLGIKFFSGF